MVIEIEPRKVAQKFKVQKILVINRKDKPLKCKRLILLMYLFIVQKPENIKRISVFKLIHEYFKIPSDMH